MKTAREMMHAGASCVQETESLMDAARLMGELDVGALPICGPDDRLQGVIADRRLVGMISEADLARHLSEEQVGHFVESTCATR
ncbi:CBS domain-containing protein [Streptomyces erythrochromogenes]|uniref:CBS domain-containing protein n=1 Tax=Streptomyces erythrochromogenes TaxID=285574 RepID=UPI00332F9DDF